MNYWSKKRHESKGPSPVYFDIKRMNKQACEERFLKLSFQF
jgi:hypothetical protein